MTEINFYSKEQTDNKLSEKANNNNVYSKSETYTKTEIDTKFEELPVYAGLTKIDLELGNITYSGNLGYIDMNGTEFLKDDLVYFVMKIQISNNSVTFPYDVYTYEFVGIQGWNTLTMPFKVVIGTNRTKYNLQISYNSSTDKVTVAIFDDGTSTYETISTIDLVTAFILRKV